MREWSREFFGSARGELKYQLPTQQLVEAKQESLLVENADLIEVLEARMHELLKRKEVMYKQRSRRVAQSGCCNTKYFQARASHRKRKNTIKSLVTTDGRKFSTDEDMRGIAREFYTDRYTSKGQKVRTRF